MEGVVRDPSSGGVLLLSQPEALHISMHTPHMAGLVIAPKAHKKRHSWAPQICFLLGGRQEYQNIDEEAAIMVLIPHLTWIVNTKSY